jgi:nucleotide-binding universal stress UspA family protein
MSADKVLKAVQEYLGEESAVFECALDPASRERVREELERARAHLRREIAAFEGHRAGGRAFGHILVAVDGSDQAGWATDLAGRIAGDAPAEVTLVHAVAEPAAMLSPDYAYAGPGMLAAQREQGEEYLRRAGARLPRGVQFEELLYEGEPARQVIAAAKECGADLIVIGTHGRGVLGRLLLGSTAEWVVRHAPCPVLAVAHSPQEPYLYDIAGTEDEVAKGPAGAVLQQKSSASGTGSHVGWPLVTSA